MKWIADLYKKISVTIKLFLYYSIISFTQKINLWKDKLINENLYPNPDKFDDLTPTSGGDNDKVYSKTLKWALENRNIFNIALTGSIGSGKSSILKTFEKEHCEYKYLNVSLASFKDQKVDEQLIELSILQQIFYHVKRSQIPDSRFKRIKSISKTNIFFSSICLVLWFCSISIFFKILPENSIFNKIIDKEKSLALWSSIVFVIGAVIIISKIIRILNNAKLNKLNIQSGEIEINKDLDQSILNKHIDEILYFFEATKFNVVVIEDLERFKDTEIFTKIRELNQLINQSKQIKRKVAFIYAIKDDKFIDENRTKFFDFIVPVIPIINTSNSGSILLEKFKNNAASNEFIEDISMYIDDMRLLKNVYNEFVIYKNKLGTHLDTNKLLALIVYKNLYPSDFAELQNNRGIIYKIFTLKDDIVKQQIESINSTIKNLNDQIKAIESENLNSIEDLRSIYILKFIEKFPYAESLKFGNIDVSFSTLKENEQFSLFTNQENIKYNNFNRTFGALRPENSTISFKTLEKEVSSNVTYKQREELIQANRNNKTEELRQAIERLNKEKNDLKSMSLEQIADKVDIENVFKEFKEDRLIIYLVRYGYIDENYHDYISFFYEGFITKEDQTFLFSIKNRKPLDFNHKLYKIENVIDRIRENEWKNYGVLNFSLINFLIANKINFKKQLDAITLLLSDESENTIKFIDSYIENQIDVSSCIKTLGNCWNDFWNFIEKSNYSVLKKDIYLKLIIKHLTIKEINRLNNTGNLSKYISNKTDFISVFADEEYSENIKAIITGLEIKFPNLIYDGSSNWLTDFIYENDNYQLNSKMIDFIVKLKSINTNFSDLKTANYTTITASNCSHLKKYIEKNINQYIKEIVLESNNNIKESEGSIINLLNNNDLSLDYKIELIEKWDKSISNIAEINDIDLWGDIVERSKMKANWKNVIEYYIGKENIFDESIITYLNEGKNYRSLELFKLNLLINEKEEFIKKISNDLVLCTDLSDDSFSHLMKSIPYRYNSLNFEVLSDNKVKWMVDNKFLALTTANYSKLKENFLGKHIELLEKYPNEYINNIDNFSITKEDLTLLLNSNAFGLIQKVSLILKNVSSIIGDQNLSKIACKIVSKYPNLIQNKDLLKSLVKYGSDTDEKLKIINNNINNLKINEIVEFLRLLDWPFSDITLPGKKPTIDENKYSSFLIEKLKDMNFISSYKTKKGKIKIYTYR